MQRAGRTRRIAEQPGGIDLGPVGNDVDVLLRTLVARGPRLGEREGAADGIRFSDGRQDAAGGIDREQLRCKRKKGGDHHYRGECGPRKTAFLNSANGPIAL